MVFAILIFSFFAESMFSNLVSSDLVLSPLFTLVSLILIYPYFNKKNSTYYKFCFAIGLLYDLVYTDTMIVNAFLFVFIGWIIAKLNNVLANNYLNNAIMSVIIIIVFRIITYLLLVITGNIDFSLMLLFKGIYSSLLSNIIYVAIGFILTDIISRKLKIERTL